MSSYPTAIDSSKVGHYQRRCKTGAGLVWDEVLEYRVWESKSVRVNSYNEAAFLRFVQSSPADACNNKHGFPDFKAFSTYEEALAFYNADKKKYHIPMALILQKEYINEPQEGVYEHIKRERIAEWQAEWLKGSKREEGTIQRILKEKQHTQQIEQDKLIQAIRMLMNIQSGNTR
jgi:hypothetical protein